jgi:ABC-type Mn2+/Zn2+ transport system ATPase subunit
MLEVRDLTAGYQGLLAIQDISFNVTRGSIMTVAGANGAGKSTLLKTISGVHALRGGSVTFDGVRIDGMKPHLITARGLAYVPETRQLFWSERPKNLRRKLPLSKGSRPGTNSTWSWTFLVSVKDLTKLQARFPEASNMLAIGGR